MRVNVYLIILLLGITGTINAQKSTDSLKVTERVEELIKICGKVDFSDPNILKMGVYYKAAPYFVYVGEDSTRSLQVGVDYTSKEEKQQVDKECKRLNEVLGQNKERVFGLFNEQEKDGKKYYSLEMLYRDSPYDSFKKIVFNFIQLKGEKMLIGIQ